MTDINKAFEKWWRDNYPPSIPECVNELEQWCKDAFTAGFMSALDVIEKWAKVNGYNQYFNLQQFSLLSTDDLLAEIEKLRGER